jgi:hypothetical protein
MLPKISRAQSNFYIQLQQIFNRIDEDLIRQPDHLQEITLRRLDSIPADSFIFPAHALSGLKLTTLANDTSRMRNWCVRAMRHGYTYEYLNKNIQTKKSLQFVSKKEADSLFGIYLYSKDTLLSKELQRRFNYDQILTKHINDDKPGLRRMMYSVQWYLNNSRNFKYIRNYIQTKGYPGDYFTTLTTDSIGFSEKGDFRAYIILLHYYSYSRKNIHDELYKEVISGHLLPYQFGVIADYLYRYGHRGYPTGEWLRVKNDIMRRIAETHRQTLGLCSLEFHEEKQIIYKQRHNPGKELLNEVGFE